MRVDFKVVSARHDSGPRMNSRSTTMIRMRPIELMGLGIILIKEPITTIKKNTWLDWKRLNIRHTPFRSRAFVRHCQTRLRASAPPPPPPQSRLLRCPHRVVKTTLTSALQSFQCVLLRKAVLLLAPDRFSCCCRTLGSGAAANTRSHEPDCSCFMALQSIVNRPHSSTQAQLHEDQAAFLR